MQVPLLALLLLLCADRLIVDDLFTAIGWRSSALSRDKTSKIIEKHAEKLNVTAQSHLNACTFIVERFWNPDYPADYRIRRLANFTQIETVVNFTNANFGGMHAADLVDEKLEFVRSIGASPEVTLFAEKIARVLKDTIYNLNLKIDDAFDEVKSKSLAIYIPLSEQTKADIERIFCAKTLMEILQNDPLTKELVDRSRAAKSIFINKYVQSYFSRRNNITADHALKVFEEEANRLTVPIQAHIDVCTEAQWLLFRDFDTIDAALVNLSKKKFTGALCNTSDELEQIFREEGAKVYRQVYLSINTIKNSMGHLSVKARMFVEGIGTLLFDTICDVAANSITDLSSNALFERIKQPVMDEYKRLPVEDQNGLEKQFCVLTTLRILGATDETTKIISSLNFPKE